VRTCLITGAGGFCGGHLARRLRDEGALRVIGTGRRAEPSGKAGLDDYVQADLCDAGQTARVVRESKPDLVFHLAGTTQGTVHDLYRVNLLGSVNLLEAVKQHAPGARVLLVGTAAEYGNVEPSSLPVREHHPCHPIDAYGSSKHAMTLASLDYARACGLKVVLARPFNVLGAGVPASLLVGAVLSRARQALQTDGDPVVRVGNIGTERDFIAVEDVADAYWRMMQGEYWGEVFNICSGRPTSVRSVITLLLSHANRRIRFESDPDLMRGSEIQTVYGSWEKAGRSFGFKPTISLERAIESAWTFAMEGYVQPRQRSDSRAAY